MLFGRFAAIKLIRPAFHNLFGDLSNCLNFRAQVRAEQFRFCDFHGLIALFLVLQLDHCTGLIYWNRS